MRCKPYCAYGSDLHRDRMTVRCPSAKLIGSGMLHGYRLVFKHHADIIPDEKSSVPVVLWEITEGDLMALNAPDYYKTISVSVDMNGEIVDAFAYMMHDKYDTVELPDKSYYDIIRHGYIDNGLDFEYIVDAYEEAFYESVK